MKEGRTKDERFAVRRHGHTDLFGIFLASHAVPDSFCLMHAGVGCKTKGQQHLANHDWLRESFSRTAWSEISDIEVITGSKERLEGAVRDWIGRRRPAVMAVATAAFVELRGEDIAGILKEMDGIGGCRLLYLPAQGYEGDLFRGYSACMSALIDTIDWERERPRGDLVNVAGYLFDRYEMDHRANFGEMRSLLGGLGLTLHRLFLSGAPYAHLLEAPGARLQVRLPYLRTRPEAGGRPWVDTHIPFGLHGTRRWLEKVAEAAEVKRETARRFIDAQLKKTAPLLQPAVDRLQGLRAAVFADTPRAASLAAMLEELGVRPLVVGLIDRSLGGKQAFLEYLAGQESELPAAAALIEDPEPEELVRTVEDMRKNEGMDLIIGTSYEIRDLAHLGIPLVETGFPSYEKHFIYPMPDIGFAGTVAFVQRLIDAVLGP